MQTIRAAGKTLTGFFGVCSSLAGLAALYYWVSYFAVAPTASALASAFFWTVLVAVCASVSIFGRILGGGD